DQLAVVRRQQHDVELLLGRGQGRDQLARRRERRRERIPSRLLEADLLAVVERLVLLEKDREILLPEELRELQVELLEVERERLLERFLDIVGQEDLAVLEQEVPDPFAAVLALDVIEDGVPEAVDQESVHVLGVDQLERG